MKTASELIASVKERGNIASAGDLLYNDDSKILGLLNDAVQHKVYPFIIENDSSFYRTREDFVIPENLRVTIPVASFNRQLYEVELLSRDRNGTPQNVPIVVLEKEANEKGYSAAFFVEGNDVVFIGNGLAGRTARLHYNKKILPLVLDNNSFKVSTNEMRNDGFIVNNPPPLFIGETNPEGTIVEWTDCYAQSGTDPFVVTEVRIVNIIKAADTDVGFAIVFDSDLGNPPDGATLTLKSEGVTRPQITDQASELVELETLLAMLLGDSKRASIERERNIVAKRIRESLKKRVMKETRTALGPNALWGSSFYGPSEHESRGYPWG